MNRYGRIIFWLGVSLSMIMGAIASYNIGVVCQIDPENLPTTIWSYPALCFTFWAFGVPTGFIIAAIGLLIHANAKPGTVLKFGLGTTGTYAFISFANGPMPHVPPLFGLGGTLIQYSKNPFIINFLLGIQ